MRREIIEQRKKCVRKRRLKKTKGISRKKRRQKEEIKI